MESFFGAEQHSLDWYRARLGNFSGSEVGKLMNAGRGKENSFGQTALSYIYKVAAERMLNPKVVENDLFFDNYVAVNDITNKAMAWGTENEPEARKLYCKVKGVEVEECPSVKHPLIEHFSSSPDGYIVGSEERGCLEIKCVGTQNWGKYALLVRTAEDLKKVNADYYWQCVAHMSVTGAAYTDFFVYNPFMKPAYILVRIERDEEMIKILENRVKEANEYIDAEIGKRNSNN